MRSGVPWWGLASGPLLICYLVACAASEPQTALPSHPEASYLNPGAGGGQSSMIQHLQEQSNELAKAHERVRQLEADYLACTSELAKLRGDYESIRLVAEERGQQLVEAGGRVEEAEMRLSQEMDERAKITDMYLAEKIRRLQIEQELIRLRLKMLDS